jgi:hypothetical protein
MARPILQLEASDEELAELGRLALSSATKTGITLRGRWLG